MPHFEITEVVLVYCDTVDNYYHQDSRVLYIFVTNKPFGSLLKMSEKIISFKTNLILNLITLKYGLQVKIVNH